MNHELDKDLSLKIVNNLPEQIANVVARRKKEIDRIQKCQLRI